MAKAIKRFCPNNHRSLTKLSQISTTFGLLVVISTFEPTNTKVIVILLGLNILEGLFLNFQRISLIISKKIEVSVFCD